MASTLPDLITQVQGALLPHLQLISIRDHDPVQVKALPVPWQLVGTGNYAAVLLHPDWPDYVVKVYAPARPGFEQEQEVYLRLGMHPAFSQCFYADSGVLILKRLSGVTLYDCLHRGLFIPPQVIEDIEQALVDARSQGLNPHDVHGRNVMMIDGRGVVVDVSDFLKTKPCRAWGDLTWAYYHLYHPLARHFKIRCPYWMLDLLRASYRWIKRLRRQFKHRSA
jgi:hypothetical protein